MAETELKNPVLRDLDAEGEKLLAITEKLDRGEPVDTQVSTEKSAERAAEDGKQEVKPETAPSAEASPEKEAEPAPERARDEHGKFIKAEEAPKPPAEDVTHPQKKDSDYE